MGPKMGREPGESSFALDTNRMTLNFRYTRHQRLPKVGDMVTSTHFVPGAPLKVLRVEKIEGTPVEGKDEMSNVVLRGVIIAAP